MHQQKHTYGRITYRSKNKTVILMRLQFTFTISSSTNRIQPLGQHGMVLTILTLTSQAIPTRYLLHGVVSKTTSRTSVITSGVLGHH